MEIYAQGTEWDEDRAQTRCWAKSDDGSEFSGFGLTDADARLDLRRALADAGHPLESCTGLAEDILAEIAADAEALERCPGGRPLEPQLDYTKAFENGRTIAVDFIEGPSAGVIEVEEAGVLDVKTGRIAAYDPLITSRDAFAIDVPVGKYPVMVSLANIEGEPRRRTIAACVKLSDAAVKAWRQALLAEEDPAELAPREMFGYGVDTGTGCFADSGVEPEELEIPEELEEYAQPAPGLVVFTTGWGDGLYPTFVGLDAAGKPARLVTDFGLLAPHSL